MAQRVQLSRLNTLTSVHCCAETRFSTDIFLDEKETWLTVDDIVVDLEET